MKLQEQLKSEYTGSLNEKKTDMQQRSFEEFEKSGFPTTKHEEWRYTSLKAITDKNFQTQAGSSAKITEFVNGLAIGNIRSNRLVFVNGIFSPGLSSVLENDAAMVIATLSEAKKKYPDILEKHFGRYAKIEGESLNALNTAMYTDGAFIYIPDGASPEYPVLVMHIADSTAGNVLVQPRQLVVIGKQASLKVVEAYYATGNHASFTNTVTEIYADEHATLEHYKVQHESGESYQCNFTQVFQEADTNINHVTLTLAGTMVRNNLHFCMNGENGNSLLYGLYITDRKNHVDNHTRVDHAKPNCFSNELYKGILKDQSTAVFNGKIMVHPDAQKTNAYQRNQNILLSDEATINTKPQLEIFADDVKCTHGATVGQLPEEPVFYLRSRGIPEAEAQKMLLNAFADAIAEEIKIKELILLLEEEIAKKL
jgi:Fe-S cluster assembly protein SufD